MTDSEATSDPPQGTTTTTEGPATPGYLMSPNAVFADEGVQWRYGKAPDYSKTRKVWEEGRKMNHAAGSLEQVVENLVKNWEVEASFKPRLSDWRTIDPEKYSFAMSGGPPQTAEHMLKAGTYNAIIEPNEYYDPKYSDFASSHKTFKRMMPTFAWEVMEVYSGPPKVAFRWRHWGEMKNDYVGFNNKGEKVTAKAHGGPIEIFGTTVATVDDQVRLQTVDTYMDSLSMFRQIAPYGVANKQAMNHKVDKSTALDKPVPDNNGIRIAETYNRGSQEVIKDQQPSVDIHKHISNGAGQPADSPAQQVGGCPFVAQNGVQAGVPTSNGYPPIEPDIRADDPMITENVETTVNGKPAEEKSSPAKVEQRNSRTEESAGHRTAMDLDEQPSGAFKDDNILSIQYRRATQADQSPPKRAAEDDIPRISTLQP